jgi:heat shock protein HslJ
MKSFAFLPFFIGLFLSQSFVNQVVNYQEVLVHLPAPAETNANSIYFKANGADPVWTLTISPVQIDFKTQATGFNPMSAPHVEPIKAMDSNIKMYKVKIAGAELNVEIAKLLCQNENSHERFPYAVTISLRQGTDTTFTYFTGCGLYITDTRLEAKWLLEQIKTETVTDFHFDDTLPYLILHANGNSFSGFGGCNTINGRIFSEHNLLRFTDFVLSKRECAPTNREKDFINALKFSTQFVVEGDHLILSNPGGPTLSFKKSDG